MSRNSIASRRTSAKSTTSKRTVAVAGPSPEVRSTVEQTPTPTPSTHDVCVFDAGLDTELTDHIAAIEADLGDLAPYVVSAGDPGIEASFIASVFGRLRTMRVAIQTSRHTVTKLVAVPRNPDVGVAVPGHEVRS